VSYNIPIKDYKFNLLEFTLNIIKNATIQGITLDEKYTQDEVIKFLKSANSLEELKIWMNKFVEYVIFEIQKLRDDKNINYIRKAKRYIEQNYTDPDLNIDKLCNMLFISPNYFSAMFKKSTNMTFTKYLTQIRLEKAKQLLKSTDKKSFEIADVVGFVDPNYFSYCFKKNVGLSPSQFRKS
jgi:two-component system response regulator YesN